MAGDPGIVNNVDYTLDLFAPRLDTGYGALGIDEASIKQLLDSTEMAGNPWYYEQIKGNLIGRKFTKTQGTGAVINDLGQNVTGFLDWIKGNDTYGKIAKSAAASAEYLKLQQQNPGRAATVLTGLANQAGRILGVSPQETKPVLGA
jgi:hypothetical protein